jgi:hypothetical protein
MPTFFSAQYCTQLSSEYILLVPITMQFVNAAIISGITLATCVVLTILKFVLLRKNCHRKPYFEKV